MGPIGIQEMIVIFIVALVLFGPKKLPELGKTIGKALTEFRRASNDLKSTFEREMQTMERENESLKEVTHQAAAEIYHHSYDETLFNEPSPHNLEAPPASASQPAAIAPPGATVDASAVPGVETLGSLVESGHPVHAQPSTPGVQGTVPRTDAPQHAATEVAAQQSHSPSEAPQHS